MGEDRQDARTTPPGRKLAVSEAAIELGISAEAVRSRIKRGTLRSVKEGGTVYVLLEDDQTPPDRAQTTDQTTARSQSDSTALISAKDETIATLKEQLEAERQAHAEARRIIAGLVERIPPAIEAPREARESPVSPGPSDTPTPAPGEAQEGAQRAKTGSSAEGGERSPWWRRMFGG